VLCNQAAEAVAEAHIGQDRFGQLLARRFEREHVGQEVREIKDGDAAGSQCIGENVVLFLRASNPWDAVEKK